MLCFLFLLQPHINFVYLQVILGSLCISFSKWFKLYHFGMGMGSAAGQSQELQTAKAAPLVCCTEGSFKQNCAQTGNNGSAASFPLLLKHTFRVVSHPPRGPPPHRRRRRRLILFSFGCSHLFIWRRCAEFPPWRVVVVLPLSPCPPSTCCCCVVTSVSCPQFFAAKTSLRFALWRFFFAPFFCRLLIAACALKAVGGC